MEIFTNTVIKQGDKTATTTMAGIPETPVDAPAVYDGDPSAMNPEEMFVASINSCIMLVFYHFANKFKVGIDKYNSEAQGKVEKTKNGLRFTSVQVNAQVSLADGSHTEKIEEIAQLAEKYCLVSGSVACPVEYKVEIVN